MAGIGGVVVIGLMAADTGRRQSRVVAVDVARRARRGGMGSGQREGRVVVVESGIRPNSCVVAEFAGRRESGCRVRRIGGTSVVCLVAGVTQRTAQRVVVADVAIRARTRRHDMCACQWEGRGVSKRAIGPQHGIVARVASCRERGGDVIHRRRRGVVIRLMARDAGGAAQAVIVVDVAIGAQARGRGMRSREREAGGGVIERRIQPVHRVVTGITGLREIGSDVIGVGRSLKVLEVAGYAGSGVETVVVGDVAIGA